MSGPVLWAPYIIPGTPRYIPRRWCTNFTINWARQFIVTPGEEMVLQETLYGGYQAHLKLHHWWYVSTSKTLDVLNAFETIYVTPPGGGAPVSAGACGMGFAYDVNNEGLPFLGIRMQGWDNCTFTYRPLPPPVSPWAPPFEPYDPTPRTVAYC